MPTAAQTHPQRLRNEEFDTIALIYNSELAALGDAALFPICIVPPAGTPSKALLRYLHRGGFPVSDEVICEPATARGGQHHPKDYPHGLRISVDNLVRDPDGTLSFRVDTVDLTIRPGVHFALLLRRGIYHLKRNEAGEWQIVGYTKEIDFRDEKAGEKASCVQPPGSSD
jgi:hypothetical protein